MRIIRFLKYLHQREERVQKKGGVALHEFGVGLLEALRPDGLLDVPQVRVEDGHQALVYQRSGKEITSADLGQKRCLLTSFNVIF